MDDEELVMRSVYLRPTEDTQLRQLAHELNVSKSDLIRSAISVKLREWLRSNSNKVVLHDLTFGRRDSAAARAAEAVASAARPVTAKLAPRTPRAAKPHAGRAKAPTRERRVAAAEA